MNAFVWKSIGIWKGGGVTMFAPIGLDTVGPFNEEFSGLRDIPSDLLFDLVVVDGAARWRCIENTLPRVKSGGHIYLDNSDADKDWAHYTLPGRKKVAQQILVDAERRGLGVIKRIRGLAPATLLATEGMLFAKR